MTARFVKSYRCCNLGTLEHLYGHPLVLINDCNAITRGFVPMLRIRAPRPILLHGHEGGTAMPRLRIVHDHESSQPTLRFPVERARASEHHAVESSDRAGEDVLAALENVSRRIDDLARELNCLGWFDDNDDSPRAA